MANVHRLRQALLDIARFAEDTGTTLHRLHSELKPNADLAEVFECDAGIRWAITELETIASSAGTLRIRLWEMLGTEGLDK